MNKLKDNKGLSLVEVVVSIGLAMVVIISIVAGVTQGAVFSKRIDMVYTATSIAQNRIDLLKKFDFEDVSAGYESLIKVDEIGSNDTNGKYLRSTEIVDDYLGNTHLKKVKVIVNVVQYKADGTFTDSENGQKVYLTNPIIVETIFSDMK
ncbi:MAG: hypothetical protein HQL29_06600 [Candidatus Omnitrophica bacterium]|nr:hypothetical protein [Candidatus Omnitrophota bacterium]